MPLISNEDETVNPAKKDLFLEELTQIDELYLRIETDIQQLAQREKKQVSEIESMLEAAAEVDTDIVGTGGLDKIVERDDEGGGE